MSTETNKSIVSRLFDDWAEITKGNFQTLEAVCAPDIAIHDPMMGNVQGVEAFKQLFSFFNEAYPGHTVKVHKVIGEDDYVTVFHTHFAKHGGTFMGLPATGKEIVVNGIEGFRIADGRIVEFWRHDDDAGILTQLGILPPPA